MNALNVSSLDILSDTEADIVTNDKRFRLSGDSARAIIGIYRHCRDDPRHGPTDAALFLWGVVEGMAYWQAKELDALVTNIRARRERGPE
jgi:hypothetical protein